MAFISSLREAHCPFVTSSAKRSTAPVESQSSPSRVPVLQPNNSALKRSSAPTQYKSNNKDAFKYRDHRGRLPASFSHSAVISQGRNNSPCSGPVCDVVEGQSNLSPQMSSDSRMLLRIQSKGNYSSRGRRT